MTRPDRRALLREQRGRLRASYAQQIAREAAEREEEARLAREARAAQERRERNERRRLEWEEARRLERERLERAAAAEGLTVSEYVELLRARQRLLDLLREHSWRLFDAERTAARARWEQERQEGLSATRRGGAGFLGALLTLAVLAAPSRGNEGNEK